MTKHFKLFITLITTLGLVFSTVIQASQQENKVLSYENEKAIVFETVNGKTTDAFEGHIKVPENRNDPNSRLISVHYVRFPATAKNSGSPIVYLAGGPGGSGIMTAKSARFPLFMALRQFGDVIAFDQRGTGRSSSAPECRSQQKIPMTEVTTEQQLTLLHRNATNECVEFWQSAGFDVLGYTTAQSAQDLNALRQHFRAEKLILWGISYGSHLALAALKTMPEKIDKVIIASAEGLDQTVKLPIQTDAYFNRLQQAINSQPKALRKYPDIRAMISKVHKQLEQQPKLLTLNKKDGTPYSFLFQKRHMQMMGSAMIADPHRGVIPLLAIYYNLNAGNTEILVDLLNRGYFEDNTISFKLMPLAMDIASGISTPRLTKFNTQAPNALLGKVLNFPMPMLNKAVEGLDLGEDFRNYPKTDVPTLLLTGTLDGRTYPQSQLQATQGLTNLTQVTVINAGHNLFMASPEVTQTIQNFLADKTINKQNITVDLPPLVGDL